MQSGFGRTGKMFAIEHYAVTPDIMALAKGIADGFSLSAFIALEEIADAFQPGEHLTTFGGNPVSCAAALANVAVLLDEDLPGHAHTLGAWAMGRLNEMARRHELISEVRGVGLLIGVGGLDGYVLRVQPPLVITRDELSRGLDVMDEALATVAARVPVP